VGDPTEIIIGIDIGGTSTRAVVVGRNGVAGPISRSPGANPSTRTTAELTDATRSAVHSALQGFASETLRALTVRAVAIGLAGLDPTRHRELEALLGPAVNIDPDNAPTVRPILRTDAEIMYAAGSELPSGIVLIAGTGAIAARVVSWRETRSIDGHGWRLGDLGSGYWIGAGVLRRVLNDLDGRDTPTAMTPLALKRLALAPLPDADASALRWAIVRTTMAMHPSDIAALSDVAVEAHADADPAAVKLISAAADELVRTVLALQPIPGEPIILGGGMFAAGPLLDTVVYQLEQHALVATPLTVEPVMGAIRIAKAAAGW
jgi:glucosamine kinase